jgi:ectoine hydroxylase-related dioxygenase (phytanoyl-CoA dioxygenase family)
MAATAPALVREEIDRFHRTGYLGPYAVCAPSEMSQLCTELEETVLATSGPNPRNPLQGRHVDQRRVFDLLTHPEILGRLRRLLGDDIVLWASYFFDKEPGDAEIPWHQDANYWPIEPPLTISIWIAIDPVHRDNSCVQLIPGSHRTVIPHVPSRDGMAFAEEADPRLVDQARAIDMELEPGEFFIFTERLLHRSARNASRRRRLGLSARFTVPFVAILDQDAPPLYPGHACVVVSGVDAFGLNRTTQPPVDSRT